MCACVRVSVCVAVYARAIMSECGRTYVHLCWGVWIMSYAPFLCKTEREKEREATLHILSVTKRHTKTFKKELGESSRLNVKRG